MILTSLKQLTAIAGLTAVTSAAFAQEEVLNIDLELFGDVLYDKQGFNAQVEYDYVGEEAQFLEDYPIFEGKSDYDIYGIAIGEATFYDFDVAPTFDTNEKYDWTVEFGGTWDYFLETAAGIDSDFGSFTDGFALFDTSVADITGLFGATPEEFVAGVLAFVAPLPGAGTLTNLIDALWSAHEISVPFDLDSISSDDIEFDTSFGMPFSHIDVIMEQPFHLDDPTGASELDLQLDSLQYLSAYALADINITATKREVPDSGSTAALVLGAFLSLVYFRKRWSK